MKLKLLDLLFPKACPLCHEIIPFGKSYCECLGKSVKRTSESFCEHCGADKDNCCCGERNAMRLSHITAPFVYTGEIRARILMLKFSGEKRESDFLGNEMALHFASVFPNARPDAVTFVPMTSHEKKDRGYNQSELLAKRVAKAFMLECSALLKKTEETERQHILSAADRVNNLKNSFEVVEPNLIKGKTVLLCDDIKTTGTTLKRCADVLIENGAADVYCLTAAISDHVASGSDIF